MVEVVPVVIGAFGNTTKEFDRWIQKLGITYNVGVKQRAALSEDIEKYSGCKEEIFILAFGHLL